MFPFQFAAIEQFFNVGLALTLGCLFAFWMFSMSFFLAFRSRTWPTTEGCVLESTVERTATPSIDRIKSDIRYEAVDRYTYSVEDKQLESKQIAFGSWRGSETDATGIIAKYPKHAVVTVSYHPKYHGMAVLEPGKYHLMLFLSLLCGVILCIVAVTWVRFSLHPEQNPWAELHQVYALLYVMAIGVVYAVSHLLLLLVPAILHCGKPSARPLACLIPRSGRRTDVI